MSNRISVRSHNILFTKSLWTILTFSLLHLFVLTVFAPASRARGFSIQKLDLYPRAPAKIPINTSNLILKFDSQAAIGFDLLQQARKNLEDFLQKQIPVNRAHETSPIEINCVVTDLQASQRNVTLWRSEYQRKGSRMETDPSTGTSRTVDDYGWVDVRYNGIAVDARVFVNYELKDPGTGIIIDAEMINTGYYQEYTTQTVPDINTVHQGLLAKAISEVGQRFAAQVFKVEVLLSKGKLRDASKLLAKRSWNDAQRLLEAMPGFSKKKDEAYRLYMLGIANEAMAYDASDIASARMHMELAAKYHAEAKAMNPDQLEFWWGEGRASDLLWKYNNAEAKARAIEEARKDVLSGRIAVDGANKRIQMAGNLKAPPNAIGANFDQLSNETIINWVKAGMPEKVIKSTVKRAARNNSYDLSTAGIADLKRAGVSARVIDQMMASQYPSKPYKSWVIMSVVGAVVLPILPFLIVR